MAGAFLGGLRAFLTQELLHTDFSQISLLFCVGAAHSAFGNTTLKGKTWSKIPESLHSLPSTFFLNIPGVSCAGMEVQLCHSWVQKAAASPEQAGNVQLGAPAGFAAVPGGAGSSHGPAGSLLVAANRTLKEELLQCGFSASRIYR